MFEPTRTVLRESEALHVGFWRTCPNQYKSRSRNFESATLVAAHYGLRNDHSMTERRDSRLSKTDLPDHANGPCSDPGPSSVTWQERAFWHDRTVAPCRIKTQKNDNVTLFAVVYWQGYLFVSSEFVGQLQ